MFRICRSLRAAAAAAVFLLASTVAWAAPVKNIKPWMIAADLTGDRAGLLLCGDLPTAAKMMTKIPSLVTDLTPTQRITELTVFAVSDAHFRIRKELGIALGTG